MDNLYREIILEHWRDPQNVGLVPSPDFTITKSNPYCGDKISFTGKVRKGRLADIKFQGKGCAISIASASLFTEHIKKKSIKNILKITQEEYLNIVNMELGTVRLKCSLFVYSALLSALINPSTKNDNISV